MDIIVKKPTAAEESAMKKNPIWTCGVSEFDWYYDSEEHCLLLEGEVTVTHAGGSASFGAGDYVILPKGLSCVWHVTKAVKKYYLFQ